MPGWQTCTEDVRQFNNLPINAKKYVEKIEEILEVPGLYIIQRSSVPNLVLYTEKVNFTHEYICDDKELRKRKKNMIVRVILSLLLKYGAQNLILKDLLILLLLSYKYLVGVEIYKNLCSTNLIFSVKWIGVGKGRESIITIQ